MITDGWFRTIIWAVKVLATIGGLSTGPATSPRLMSFLAMPRTLKPTLSPGLAAGQLLVVHLDALDLADLVGRHEDDLHVRLQDAGLDPSDRDGSDTGDGVDVLDREPAAAGWSPSGARDFRLFSASSRCRALVPGHVGGRLGDVVALVSADTG